MKEFTRGQKTKLSDLGVDNNLVVGLIYNSPGILIDFSCFGLDKDNKLSDDRYLQFFNQPSSPCNSINASYTSDKATFTIDLSKLPQTTANYHKLLKNSFLPLLLTLLVKQCLKLTIVIYNWKIIMWLDH